MSVATAIVFAHGCSGGTDMRPKNNLIGAQSFASMTP